MEIVQRILDSNKCYKAGKKITVKGLVLHSVGCPQPSAEVFLKSFNKADVEKAVHAFIDGNTGTVYQTLPWNHRVWHCGGKANNTHIGVEMCEPPNIKYKGGANFTCSDEVAAREVVYRTLNAATELFATLCIQYKLDPLGDGVIISHREGHSRGVASGHGDPDHLFKQLHMDYTMDDFRKAVKVVMNKTDSPQELENIPKTCQQIPPSHVQIMIGDTVTLTDDAVYYTDKPMADWVKRDKWIVKTISGDRAVLGKNVNNTHEINSPVHTKYLNIVSAITDAPEI